MTAQLNDRTGVAAPTLPPASAIPGGPDKPSGSAVGTFQRLYEGSPSEAGGRATSNASVGDPASDATQVLSSWELLQSAAAKRESSLVEKFSVASSERGSDASEMDYETLRAEVLPTDRELRAFKTDKAVQSVVGDTGLLADDDATRALMISLADVEEGSSPSGAQVKNNPVFERFGLDAQGVESLSERPTIGAMRERTGAWHLEEAGGYAEETPGASMSADVAVDENGAPELKVTVEAPKWASDWEKNRVDEMNENLEVSSDRLQHQTDVVTRQGSVVDSFSAGSEQIASETAASNEKPKGRQEGADRNARGDQERATRTSELTARTDERPAHSEAIQVDASEHVDEVVEPHLALAR